MLVFPGGRENVGIAFALINIKSIRRKNHALAGCQHIAHLELYIYQENRQ
jgi:hypothetical protein